MQVDAQQGMGTLRDEELTGTVDPRKDVASHEAALRIERLRDAGFGKAELAKCVILDSIQSSC